MKYNNINAIVIFVIQEVIMLAIRLAPRLEKRLDCLAKNNGRSKSYYVKQAIEDFLCDREDYLLA
jgi:RHH-type transcriptional regulator, rel operon repressor / antitoxin RelB